MTTIYLAAPWREREQARAARDSFVSSGIGVNSRWLDFEGEEGNKAEEVKVREALHDLEDIWKADGMVVLQYGKSEGKAFEQGFFLGISGQTGCDNKIVVVGPDGERGNVFQYLPQVFTIVPTVEAAIEEVKRWRNNGPIQTSPEEVRQ